MDTARKTELRAMLMERRREVASEVKRGIRDVRAEGVEKHNSRAVRDPVDVASDDVQEDIELALIQIRAETLNRIDQALGRLNRDVYGLCSDCSGEITEKRLRALPFAVRCKDCQETQEAKEQRSRRRGFGLFANLGGPQFYS